MELQRWVWCRDRVGGRQTAPVARMVVLTTLAAMGLAACGGSSASNSATASTAASGTSSTAASSSGAKTGLASLPAVAAKISCAQLARKSTKVAGLEVAYTTVRTGRASASAPQYCELEGTIAGHIGFEVLMPTKTWRGRYLQAGCGGTCGMVSISPAQADGYAPLENGYFVVASDNEGHSGMGWSWASNPAQRVDFAYLSEHDLALVSKGLAATFYGVSPRFSYYDGCSQGGHEALTEVQRYPKDFQGVLAGAPASITAELNGLLHEWTDDVNISSSGHPIVTTTQAQIVNNYITKKCATQTGLILDFRACSASLDLSSLACSATATSNCLTSAQIAVFEKIYTGPQTSGGVLLFPGGYSPGTELSLGFPSSSTTTVSKASASMGEWLEYLLLGKTLGSSVVANEQFTPAFFAELEKYASLWDATDPNLAPFEKAGGKLILWQGGTDPSIPTNSSLAYYQAVVKAMGGVAATQKFAKYYILPSVDHCGSGNGADTFAGLASVVSWTETGTAPTTIVAAKYSGSGQGGPAGGPTTGTSGRSSGPGAGSSGSSSGGTLPTGTTASGGPSSGTIASGGPPSGTIASGGPPSGTIASGGPPSGGLPSGGPGSSGSSTSIPALGTPSSGSVTRTISLYPYPEMPAYSGRGSVTAASSYVAKVSAAIQQVIPWMGSFTTTQTWCNAQGLDCRTVS